MNYEIVPPSEYPYIIRFAHQHLDFRIPEFLSLCDLFNVRNLLKIPPSLAFLETCPFLPVGGIPLSVLKEIISRSILIRNLYQLYTWTFSLDDLITTLQTSTEMLNEIKIFSTSSFKFVFDTFGSTFSFDQQKEYINRFKFLPLNGPINLSDPDVSFVVFGCFTSSTWKFEKDIWSFGRLLATSNRSLMDVYDLKKRSYIGITSMNAELSLIMSNMALVNKGSLVFDPFVGTGSFLMTCAHFGGYTLGCDIDGRQIRGKGGADIQANAKQYNLSSKILGTFVCDITKNPLRSSIELFDAIVTDPPYGIRAGAKKIVSLDPILVPKVDDCMKPVYPKTMPYPTSQVYADLICFAAKSLIVGGRLVFWIPAIDEDTDGDDGEGVKGSMLEIPTNLCLKLIAKSEQKLNNWSRWLVTMEKISSDDTSINSSPSIAIPKFFRTDYFRLLS